MTPEERFRRLYADHFDALLGYALRRTDTSDDAADVVADTFLVAWRRPGEVPDGERARMWLYGVARRTLANQRRGRGRRDRLGERLRDELALVAPDPADAAVERQRVATALARVSPADREVLELSAWEALEPREIAEVLGVSAVVVRARLSRARGRLRLHLLEAPESPPPPPPPPPGSRATPGARARAGSAARSGHVHDLAGHLSSRHPMTVPEEAP